MGKKKGKKSKPGRGGIAVQGTTAAAAQEVKTSRQDHETPFPEADTILRAVYDDMTKVLAITGDYSKLDTVRDAYAADQARHLIQSISSQATLSQHRSPTPLTVKMPLDDWMTQALKKSSDLTDEEQRKIIEQIPLVHSSEIIRTLIRYTLLPAENKLSEAFQESLATAIRQNFDEVSGSMVTMQEILQQVQLNLRVASAQIDRYKKELTLLRPAKAEYEKEIAQYKEQIAELSSFLLLAEEKMGQEKPSKSKAHEVLEKELVASKKELAALKKATKTQEKEAETELKEAVESQRAKDAAAKELALAEQAGRHADEKERTLRELESKITADHKAAMAKLEAEIATRVAAEVAAQSIVAETNHQQEIDRLAKQHQEQIAELESQLALAKKTSKTKPAVTIAEAASQTEEVESKKAIVVTVKPESDAIEELKQENAKLRAGEKTVREAFASAVAQFHHEVGKLAAGLTKAALGPATTEPTTTPGPESADGLGAANSKKSQSL